jgi:hypothetical protein
MADNYGKAAKDDKKFRKLPEKRNKKELGQGKISLAPMLHWDTGGKKPYQQKEMGGDSVTDASDS